MNYTRIDVCPTCGNRININNNSKIALFNGNKVEIRTLCLCGSLLDLTEVAEYWIDYFTEITKEKE